ncbi:MAG: DUF916 domain-containing protein [Patescibacteria group bacterium]
MKKYALLIGVFLVIPFMFFAQGANALQLSPTIFDIAAKPGEVITKAVRLTNETTAPMTLSHTAGIFEAAAEGNGTPTLLPKPKDINSIADWISIPTPKVTLQPGQKLDVPFTITVPADAEAGGHYGWISWNEAPSKVDGSGVAIASGIATQILLSIEGDVIEMLELQSFQTKDGTTSFEKLPITFTANIYNSGNVHEKPVGVVTIKNIFGSTVATLPFNDAKDSGNILPKAGRVFNVDWAMGFAFGKYTATLNASYDNGKMLSGTVDFWVLSKALLAVWIVIIIIVVALIAMSVMRSQKKSMPASKMKK